MNIKKIAAFAAAAVMAAGICTGVPVGTENVSPLAVTAEAASSDFVIETAGDGYKCLMEYKGKGGDIVIPKEVETINTDVFSGNADITSVTVKGSYVWLNPDAFAECVNLKKVVFEGDATFAKSAFKWCINLESVTVKGSVRSGIYTAAFLGCQSLKTVKIGKNDYDFVIDGNAFRDCISLTSINIPSKCTDIYGCAFLNCFSLEKLTIPSKTKINTDNNGDCHLGYAYLYNTMADVKKSVSEDNPSAKTFVANGKTSGYYFKYITSGSGTAVGNYNSVLMVDDGKKYTPKQLTLTVTKGSSAEKWAKSNKVKYVYAKSSASSEKAAAPANVKASSTKNSVTLTWGKASGADFYRVYKYNSKTKKYEKYKDVTAAKCTVSKLSAGTKYKFKVVSYSKNNGKSVKGGSSKEISAATASANSSKSTKSDKNIVGNDTAGYITTYFDYKYTEADDGSFSIVSTDGKDRTNVFFYDDIQTDLDQTAYMFCLAAAMNAESDGFKTNGTSSVKVDSMNGYFSVAIDNEKNMGFKLYLSIVDSKNGVIRVLTHESTSFTPENVLAASEAFDSYHLKKS